MRAGAGYILIALSLFTLPVQDLVADQSDKVEEKEKLQILKFFAAPPSEAKLPSSVPAVQLYNSAAAHFQKREFDLAKHDLSESLRLEPSNSHAYELLGEIAYMNQDLKDAKAQYQIAYALDPNPGLKAKIEKIIVENKTESKFSSYDEEHFIIRYRDSDKTVEGYEYRELLRLAYGEISRDFAYYFQSKIVVLLYGLEEFKQLGGIPHWSTGLFDGKVRMPMSRGGLVDRDLSAVAHHELTHAFIAAMSLNRAPAWVQEGLAQYEEHKIRPINPALFRAALKKGSILSWEKMIQENQLLKKNDNSEVGLFYQQSFMFVTYLINRFHMFAVKQMLEDFGRVKNSEEVIRDTLMISPQKLYQEWLESLQVKP